MAQFFGSWVALVTPMTADGTIDYNSLQSLIDWHIDSATTGLVVMGTTGESATVSIAEHIAVAEKAVEYAEGRIPIVLGNGAIATDKTVSLTRQLNDLHPSGFLTATPYYVKPNQEGLYRHYCMVADASEWPIILYNVPGRTCCDLANETVIRLMQHGNIHGLKDATADISRVAPLKQCNPDFSLLSGDDETALDFMKAGGDGVISVTANIAPKTMAQWCYQAAQGEWHQALQTFEQIIPLHKNLFVESNPIPVKWSLYKMGKIPQGIRLPLLSPSVEAKQQIEHALKQCHIFTVEK